MKKKSVKNRKNTKNTKKRRQTLKYNMVGCCKNHKHTKDCLIHGCKCKCNCKKCKQMKGGSGCGPCGCPIAPMSWNKMQSFVQNHNQNGGNCDVMGCGPIQGIGQNGGGPVPGPFVGNPWGTNPVEWPGADGIDGNRNYLENYKNVIQNDPTRQISMNDANYKPILKGGYVYNSVDTKSKSRKSKKNTDIYGGGLLPQDLVNLGRSATFNIKSAYNAFNGYKAPVNPLPYKDQLISKR